MQTRNNSSLLDLRNLSFEDCQQIFSLASKFKKHPFENKYQGRSAALLFFEPSTRTRMSFEMAAVQLGLHPLILSGKQSTSLEKGESLEDTILNVASMGPSVVIVRAGENLDLPGVAAQLKMPVINAGWSVAGHPTQALLDVYTLMEKGCKMDGLKVLIVGDIRHSRVAASHVELSKVLNYQLAWCGPTHFLPSNSSSVNIFDNFDQALQWCDVVMCLRVQTERHDSAIENDLNAQGYRQDYGLTVERLSRLRAGQWVLHPGPINQGVELDREVLRDRRSLVLEQVQSGVFVRQALLARSQGFT